MEKSNSYLVVYGYTGTYAVYPAVDIYLDGEYYGSVKAKSKTVPIPITKITTVTFKASIRKREITVNPNVVTIVQLEFNRFWGTLKAVVEERDPVDYE